MSKAQSCPWFKIGSQPAAASASGPLSNLASIFHTSCSFGSNAGAPHIKSIAVIWEYECETHCSSGFPCPAKGSWEIGQSCWLTFLALRNHLGSKNRGDFRRRDLSLLWEFQKYSEIHLLARAPAEFRFPALHIFWWPPSDPNLICSPVWEDTVISGTKSCWRSKQNQLFCRWSFLRAVMTDSVPTGFIGSAMYGS